MNDKITIGGRQFRSIRQSTTRHDDWVMDRLRRSGLEPVPVRGPEETKEAYGWRVLGMLHGAGAVYEILGALIIPARLKDLQWSPKLARETGEFLQELWREEDKTATRLLVVGLLFPFLRDELGSFASSSISSPALPTAVAETEATNAMAGAQ